MEIYKSYIDTKILDTRLAADALMHEVSPKWPPMMSDCRALLEIISDVKQIQAAIKSFDLEIWRPRLRSYYRDSRHRGHSAQGE